MLPPGHVAAGFLVAEALLKITQPGLSSAQASHLLWWGMFWGFAPDLDVFRIFFREKSFTIRNPQKNDHRNFWSHAPVLWLGVGLGVYFFASSVYIQFIGLLLWLASWSHFLLDSLEYGIMWLWPFSKNRYALKTIEIKENNQPGFFGYWRRFLKIYLTRISFYLEILVIISALIVYLR